MNEDKNEAGGFKRSVRGASSWARVAIVALLALVAGLLWTIAARPSEVNVHVWTREEAAQVRPAADGEYRAALADGPQVAVGLYWYASFDPTTAGGMAAPLNQLLVRTDTPSIYYKSGAANTAWTKIGTGTGGGGTGTVTSITCSTGLTCAPNPIVAAGTVSIANTAVTAGTYTNATLTVNAQGQLTAASSGTAPVTPSGTLTNNTIPVASGASTIKNSNETDNGTTFAIASTEVTVTLANGNTAIAGTLTADAGNRVIDAVSTGLTQTANSVAITNTAVTPGSYTNASVTVNAQGQITAASSGTAPATGTGTNNTITKWTGTSTLGNSAVTDNGTTFAINTTALTVVEASGNTAVLGTLTADAGNRVIDSVGTGLTQTANSVAITNTAVTAGTYTNATLTVNAQGQLTAASSGTAPVTGTGTAPDLMVWATSSSAGNFAGSTPSACSAGNATTGPSISAAGALGNACSPFTTNAPTTMAGATISPTDTGTLDNYNPTGLGTASIIRMNNASTATIDGIVGGTDGRFLWICGINSTVNLAVEAAGSTAANRIVTTGNVNAALIPGATNPNSCASLQYDATSSRWRVLAVYSPTTSPTQTFTNGVTIQAASTTSSTLTFNNVNAGANVIVLSTASGHISTVGATAPTLTSCGATPSPTIHGSDIAGKFTTGGTATACTLTFVSTYTNPPACLVTTEGGATQPTYTTSATAITFTVDIAQTTYNYWCIKVQ